MPVRFSAELSLRAAVSVTQMAAMLGMSRASLYERIRKGHFLPPIYAVRTRRPVYTADLQKRNLEVRAAQVGVNGEFALFYDRRPRLRNDSLNEVEHSIRGRRNPTSSLAAGLRERLTALGLEGITERRIEDAVIACFPSGTNGTPENDVLRVVYRCLRRSDPAR